MDGRAVCDPDGEVLRNTDPEVGERDECSG